MIQPAPVFRPATVYDAAVLAELVDFAGEGLPVYLWERSKDQGETVWDFGKQRAMRDEGSFSYRNANVAEIDGRVVASLMGYALDSEPSPIGPDMPAIFRPLQELENLAPATWYVNVLAVFPEHRGRGLLAEDAAGEARLQRLSIIVSDGNPGARRLYERCGYVEQASRPMVKEGWANPGRNWVLLTKDL